MGNTCVGPRTALDGFLPSVLWRLRSPSDDALSSPTASSEVPPSHEAPEPLSIPEATPEENKKNRDKKKNKKKKKAPLARVSSAGLCTDSVLRRKTENIRELYTLGRKLGQGQFGTTYLCVDKATGKEFACKSISKRKLLTEDDVDDVRREIQIMHHVAGHPNVVSILGVYEDAVAVHLVMELCAGGELFDRIVQRGHYSEKAAAQLARVIVDVVETCHSLGVMHRDLKPENFLCVDQSEESPLKTIDFGLSVFFKPGTHRHGTQIMLPFLCKILDLPSFHSSVLSPTYCHKLKFHGHVAK